MDESNGSQTDRDLIWYLERGLGRGLSLLREALPDEARRVVGQVCSRETRWDPAVEDRSFYLTKALAIAGNGTLEEELLDRWERNIPLRFRGPWSEVGLVLAGLGRPRAVELAILENLADLEEEGPGFPAAPEGIQDVQEWLAAIRDDARLRVGGGLKLGRITGSDDRDHLFRALDDDGCAHLQEAVAVAYTRVSDDRARDWFADRVEDDPHGERAFWWWQGLSGQRPAPRVRALALREAESAPAVFLQWIQLTLFRNIQPGDDAVHLRLLERGLSEGAEDLVSVTLDRIEQHPDPAYAVRLRAVICRSASGTNRARALELAGRDQVAIPETDLLDLLEDSEIRCRMLALGQLPGERVAEHLVALGGTEGEDPAFLEAVRAVFQ